MKFPELKQTDRPELLDLHHGSLAEVRRSLHDIRRINTVLGGTKIICDATFALLEKHNLKCATILDIGTGSADIPRRLISQARRRNIKLRVLALDISERHLEVAREDLPSRDAPHIELIQGDAFHLPLEENSVDLVISSLFLHHFRASQIHQLLNEFSRVATRGWIMNDLIRHPIPLWFFRLLRPVFARSYLTRHDGEASIRRAYTLSEMQEIIASSGFENVTVREHFPYRMSLIYDKTS